MLMLFLQKKLISIIKIMMRFEIIDECESAVFEALCTISTLSMFWVQHVQRVPLWGKFFV